MKVVGPPIFLAYCTWGRAFALWVSLGGKGALTSYPPLLGIQLQQHRPDGLPMPGRYRRQLGGERPPSSWVHPPETELPLCWAGWVGCVVAQVPQIRTILTKIKWLKAFNCGTGEDFWESLGLQGNQTSQSKKKLTLNIHWRDGCESWNSNPLATWCEQPSPWKRPWCWERLKAKGEGGGRVSYSSIASLNQWVWVWANSGR